MCRSIKNLYNFDPPVTEEEVRSASLQFVRKISGLKTPSQINEAAFNKAVIEISKATQEMLNSLQTKSPPRNREEENEKAKLRSIKRFGISNI